MGLGEEVERAKNRRKGPEVSVVGSIGVKSQEAPAKTRIVGEAPKGSCCLS